MYEVSWDDLFMSMVYLVASKSKDNSTHIGAVVVGSDKEVRSVGYNGFPRGIDDDVEERQKRPYKYGFFEHAERNAIYNAVRIGVSLKECIMYTNGMPCADCARAIIQSGVKEVVIDYAWDKDNSTKWAESGKISKTMFDECGVNIRYYVGDFIKLHKYKRGKMISL